jgi:hypothetical protein
VRVKSRKDIHIRAKARLFYMTRVRNYDIRRKVVRNTYPRAFSARDEVVSRTQKNILVQRIPPVERRMRMVYGVATEPPSSYAISKVRLKLFRDN